MLRKGKLYKICIRCKKEYKPNGKSQKICNNCKKRKTPEWMLKLIKK